MNDDGYLITKHIFSLGNLWGKTQSLVKTTYEPIWRVKFGFLRHLFS